MSYTLKIFLKVAQKDSFENGADGRLNACSMDLEFTGKTFLEALRKAKNELSRYDETDYYSCDDEGESGSFTAYEDNSGDTVEGKKADFDKGDVWLVDYTFSVSIVSPFKIPQSE